MPNELEAERTRAVEFIRYATETLRGPMPNFERALMAADRSDARRYLAEVEAKIAAKPQPEE